MKELAVRDTVGQQLRALADETRRDILACLGADECCVCELMETIGVPQSLLSFHLRVLKEAGLVTDRRDGRWSYYAVNTEALQHAALSVESLASAPRRTARKKRRAC